MVDLITSATLNGGSISLTIEQDDDGDGTADVTEQVSVSDGETTTALSTITTGATQYRISQDISGEAQLHSHRLATFGVTGFAVADGSGSEFDLSWDGDAYPSGEWRIFRSTVDSPTYPGDYTHIDTVSDPGATSYTDTLQKDGRTFSWFVRRLVDGNTTDSSRVTLAFADEDQPVLGNGVEDEVAIDRETAVSGYGDVRFQIRDTGEATWDSNAAGYDEQVIDSGTITTIFAGREDGEEYEVRGRTEAEDITGAWTAPVSIVAKLPGITNLTSDTVTETSVDLSWQDNADNEDGIDVERAKQYDDGWGPFRDFGTLDPNTEAFADDTVSPNRTYRYRLRIFTEHADATSTIDVDTATNDVRQTNVPTRGWYVEVDHPSGRTLTPSIIAEDVDYPTPVNDLPRVRIPIPKADIWLNDQQLEEQPLRVWQDGKRKPIGQLENVRERPDRVILEGRGGLALTNRVTVEYTEEEAQAGAADVIGQTGLAYDVDDPTTETSTDDRMQSADTTSEWLDRLATLDDIVTVENGVLTTYQVGYFGEAEDGTIGTNGSVIGSSTYSSEEAVGFDGPTGLQHFVEVDIETDHDIPAGDVQFAARLNFLDDGDMGFNLLLDGQEVESYSADSNVGTGTSWRTTSQYSSSLPAGTHTLRIEFDEDSTTDDGSIDVDALALWDGRYASQPGNSVTGGVLSWDLYPGGIEQEMTDAVTFLSIVAGKLTSSWNGTSGDQAVAISNDQGQNWIEATNSETVEGEFASGAAQIRARFRLAGYDPDPDTSPAGRKVPHEVDLYDLYADQSDLPLLINKKHDGSAKDALQRWAQFADALWTVIWDESIDDERVVWTWPGLRTRESSVDLVDYETAKLNEESYEQVLVKGQAKTETGDSVTADIGNAAPLEHGDIVEGSGRVYNRDDGTEYSEGSDYELARIPGELTALSGGSISDGEPLAVDYNWKISGVYPEDDMLDTNDPKVVVRDVPSLPSERMCQQAALYLYRVVDEPLIRAEATVDELPPDVSVVETLTIPNLPTAGEAVELQDITQSEKSPTFVLGNRQGLGEALQKIRSRLQDVSELV